MLRVVYKGEGCTGCKICSLACAYAHDGAFSLKGGRIWIVKEEPATDFPVVCHQCVKAPCLEICPVGAITRENGVILVNEDMCIGCGACVEACPFGEITIHPSKNVAIKCDLCGGDPECVKQCPAGVLEFKAPRAVAQEKRRG